MRLITEDDTFVLIDTLKQLIIEREEYERKLKLASNLLCNTNSLDDIFLGIAIQNTGRYKELENNLYFSLDSIYRIKKRSNISVERLTEIEEKALEKVNNSKIYIDLLKISNFINCNDEIFGIHAFKYLLELVINVFKYQEIEYELIKEECNTLMLKSG